MSNERVTIEGVDYVQPPCCSFGDYGGAGSLGLSNIRYLIEQAGDSVFPTSFQDVNRASEGVMSAYALDSEIELRQAVRDDKPTLLHATGDYSSEAVWIRADRELATETLAALEDYPVLDESGMSAIESEWESEAWDSWLRSDLERAAWPGDDEPSDEAMAAAYEALHDGDKMDAYRAAMDECNEYPEAEHNGVSVNVERIAPTYRRLIEERLSATA